MSDHEQFVRSVLRHPQLAGVEERLRETIDILGIVKDGKPFVGHPWVKSFGDKLVDHLGNGRGLAGNLIDHAKNTSQLKNDVAAPTAERLIFTRLDDLLRWAEEGLAAWEETLTKISENTKPSALRALGEPWKLPWSVVAPAYRTDVLTAAEAACAREGIPMERYILGAWLGAETPEEKAVLQAIKETKRLYVGYGEEDDFDGEKGSPIALERSLRGDNVGAFAHAFSLDYKGVIVLDSPGRARMLQELVSFQERHPRPVKWWLERQALRQAENVRPSMGTMPRDAIEKEIESLATRYATVQARLIASAKPTSGGQKRTPGRGRSM